MDRADVVYDQPSTDVFSKKLETVQYNAALAIMGAIKSTFREKLCQELGLEYLRQRRWMRLLCLLTKLFQLSVIFIPPVREFQRHPNTFNSSSCRTEYLKNSLFPCVIGEWDNLNREIRRSGSYNILISQY